MIRKCVDGDIDAVMQIWLNTNIQAHHFISSDYIILNQIDGIEDWYVMVRKGKTIKYNDFINNIKAKDYYDANHVIIELNNREIDDLLDKYDVNIVN